jgi:hypothetical protein
VLCCVMVSPIGSVRMDMYSHEPYAAAGASMLCMVGSCVHAFNFHLFPPLIWTVYELTNHTDDGLMGTSIDRWNPVHACS